MRFDGKTAIVTGAASGMGKAAALKIADLGADVAVVDMNEEKGEETAAQIRQNNQNSIFIKADVTFPDDVRNYVDAAVDRFGKIDFFFNNAGIVGDTANIAEQSIEQISGTIDINLKGVMYGLKYVIKAMLDNGGGVIVNTASGSGLDGVEGLSTYSASKHGVIGVTKSVAREYADQNIRINAIAPGSIKTPIIDNIDPERQKQIEAGIPMKRQGEPAEIAEIVAFLLSKNAAYITGSVIPIDGGNSA
ncbi:SDR family NAD(P)-dependent oxidoreductase [Salinicoccus albus]|uniref:SDR family NAD(P)-dependent oxidoreductase n=1 Tax=Salinicoccus albus TaxID=418756 RepID=UPI0003822730|nr:SDR family NAD(P)-dependent oxidoreductase [Salinicoccus albus]